MRADRRVPARRVRGWRWRRSRQVRSPSRRETERDGALRFFLRMRAGRGGWCRSPVLRSDFEAPVVLIDDVNGQRNGLGDRTDDGGLVTAVAQHLVDIGVQCFGERNIPPLVL